MRILRPRKELLVDSYRFGGGGGGADPFFANVVALLHLDGADGSQVYTDVTGRVWTQGSGTTSAISTAQSVSGGASYLNYNGTTRIGWFDTPSSAGFAFGLNELTVEMFVYLTTGGTTNFVYDARQNNGIIFAIIAQSFWVFSAGGFRIQAGTVPVNAWSHLAYTRTGSGGSAVGRAYIDGVSVGSWNDTANYGNSDCVIGVPTDNRVALWHQGYIDEIRVTNGVARYTGAGSFTPPAVPFPDS